MDGIRLPHAITDAPITRPTAKMTGSRGLGIVLMWRREKTTELTMSAQRLPSNPVRGISRKPLKTSSSPSGANSSRVKASRGSGRVGSGRVDSTPPRAARYSLRRTSRRDGVETSSILKGRLSQGLSMEEYSDPRAKARAKTAMEAEPREAASSILRVSTRVRVETMKVREREAAATSRAMLPRNILSPVYSPQVHPVPLS